MPGIPGPDDWEAVEAEDGTYFIGSVDASMAAWAERNGCDPEPVERAAGPETTQRTWTGCASDRALLSHPSAGRLRDAESALPAGSAGAQCGHAAQDPTQTQ